MSKNCATVRNPRPRTWNAAASVLPGSPFAMSSSVISVERRKIAADDLVGAKALHSFGAGIPTRNGAVEFDHIDRVIGDRCGERAIRLGGPRTQSLAHAADPAKASKRGGPNRYRSACVSRTIKRAAGGFSLARSSLHASVNNGRRTCVSQAASICFAPHSSKDSRLRGGTSK